VLEVGCGTGAVTRLLARRPGVAEAVGVDPSPVFIAKAGELAAGLDNLSFEEGDGRALRFGDGDFDVVVCHTVLCHVPEPERVLTEALRVLRPGGTLAGSATGTTPRPPWRSVRAIPSRTASRP
jgi:ubiquinone/menaquinone biosynthesis C-methylase UbiE